MSLAEGMQACEEIAEQTISDPLASDEQRLAACAVLQNRELIRLAMTFAQAAEGLAGSPLGKMLGNMLPAGTNGRR